MNTCETCEYALIGTRGLTAWRIWCTKRKGFIAKKSTACNEYKKKEQ